MGDERRENAGEATEEKVGEGVGGLTGALAGAGLGSLAGPIGTVVGGIAGGVGGWWAGEKVGRAVADWNDDDEDAFKHHYDSTDGSVEADAARVGYTVGYTAAENPDYQSYGDVDMDLRSNWTWGGHSYDSLQPHIRAGYERRVRRLGVRA